MGQKAVSYLFRGLSVVFAAALLVIIVVCHHATRVPPEEGAFWVLAAMALPVMIGVAFVAALWWLLRGRWVAFAMAVVAIALNLTELTAVIRWPGSNREQPSDVRIATLNVHGFSCMGPVPFSASAIAAVACREGADVVCMQEMLLHEDFPADSVASLFLPQLPYFVQQGSEMLVSRYPIERSGYERFPDSDNDCLWADLILDGEPLRVVSVHLQTTGISSLQHRYQSAVQQVPVGMFMDGIVRNSQIRAMQVETVRGFIAAATGGVILAGDFNEIPSSYVYNRMKGDLTDGFRDAGHGYGSTFHPFGGLLRIDYIFYDKRFEAVRYRALEEELSDHRMVIADLNIKR